MQLLNNAKLQDIIIYKSQFGKNISNATYKINKILANENDFEMHTFGQKNKVVGS